MLAMPAYDHVEAAGGEKPDEKEHNYNIVSPQLLLRTVKEGETK